MKKNIVKEIGKKVIFTTMLDWLLALLLVLEFRSEIPIIVWVFLIFAGASIWTTKLAFLEVIKTIDAPNNLSEKKIKFTHEEHLSLQRAVRVLRGKGQVEFIKRKRVTPLIVTISEGIGCIEKILESSEKIPKIQEIKK